MKNILLPESGNGIRYYRANLHCHSTISDGRKTPEELKRDYMAHGYSIIAFTDHEAFIRHNDLTDEDFLALNGYELDADEHGRSDGEDGRTCHICFVALSPDTEIDPCYHRTDYFWGNCANYRDRVVYDKNAPDYVRLYSAEGINDMIKRGVEGGFFVTYNHPAWSLESFPEYSRYRGMHAMEIANYSSFCAGWEEDNGRCYDDFLNQGKRIFCIATDDNHNRNPDPNPMCDSYGGYINIAASKLSYEAVAEALRSGYFYASLGSNYDTAPEILSLEYEDGKVRIKTSPAKSIQMIQNIRRCHKVNAEQNGCVTEAEFEVHKRAKWFRLVVTDDKGHKSYTNAYFTDEI
ncbi:MAG: CehA/McbA family metallohydrolase [Clostridia bacterium]|nr:CehA/McbA family metallohydrolase [Clostridia bacterium]